jgi:hypothetical protein
MRESPQEDTGIRPSAEVPGRSVACTLRSTPFDRNDDGMVGRWEHSLGWVLG